MAVRKPTTYRAPYTRIREKNEFQVSLNGTEFTYHGSCGANTPTPNGWSYSTTGSFTTMTDTVTPGFRKMASQGLVLMSPMKRHFLQVLDNGGSGWHLTTVANTCTSPLHKGEDYWKGSASQWFLRTTDFRGYAIPWVPPRSNDSRMRSIMTEVATAVHNARGRSDANLFETLAEMDQTLGMLDKPIQRAKTWVRSADRAIASGRFGKHLTLACTNAWLAYRYGINPIMKDIQAITEGLKKERKLQRVTTRAKAGFEQSWTDDVAMSKSIFDYVLRYETGIAVTVRGMSLDDVELSLLDNLGFTFKGLVTLPWELVTASFVADWFINVGDVLGSVVPSPGWTQLGSCMTVTTGSICDISMPSVTNKSPSVYTLTSSPSLSVRVQSIIKERFALPAAGLVVRGDFRLDRFTRAADAMSLLSQQISRVFNPSMRRVGVPVLR